VNKREKHVSKEIKSKKNHDKITEKVKAGKSKETKYQVKIL